jgi:hypothetical protein
VNLYADGIISPETKKSSKLSIEHFISLTLDHPMQFSCVPMLLKVYSGIELSSDFIVPILLKSQNFSQVFGCASCNDSIKYGIMLALHICLINPLRVCHKFALGNDY